MEQCQLQLNTVHLETAKYLESRSPPTDFGKCIIITSFDMSNPVFSYENSSVCDTSCLLLRQLCLLHKLLPPLQQKPLSMAHGHT